MFYFCIVISVNVSRLICLYELEVYDRLNSAVNESLAEAYVV